MNSLCSSSNAQLIIDELNHVLSTLILDDHSITDNTLFQIENQPLHLLAQPKVYSLKSSHLNPNSYFILTEDQSNQYKYPTIRIPSWLKHDEKFYIRVTLVTVINDQIPYHYIHPYYIDTIDENVLFDKENNSIYFRLGSNDFKLREKSFQISIMKTNNHEPLRLFDHDTICQKLKENPISHQFNQAQLIFTLTYQNSSTRYPSALCHTSVKSQIISEQNIDAICSKKIVSFFSSNELIRCIPRQSRWQGGEEMIINFPDEIQRTKYTICFDFGQYGLIMIDNIKLLDRKTILFQIPPCLYPLIEIEYVKIWVYIQKNNVSFQPIEFSYFAQSMKKTQENTSKFENQTKLDQYLAKLTNSMEIYIRTNDPSKLFRRTRILLLQETVNPTLLHESIENGHGQIVFSFIEQIIDIPSANRLLEARNINDETLLLIAGKFQQWEIVEFILKKRPNYISQMNKQGQTIVTILANCIDKQQSKIVVKNLIDLYMQIR